MGKFIQLPLSGECGRFVPSWFFGSEGSAMEPLGSWCRGNLKGRKRSLQQRCSTGCTVDAGEFLLLGKGFAGRRRIV